MKQLVFLMGMPGCGKSTIGKKLAKKIKFEFIDLDDYIEKKEKKSIRSIFNDMGESSFRNIETHYLKEIISASQQAIVSLGGGTPCFNDNLEFINENGFSIYFEAPIKLLSDRIYSSKKIRPIFQGLNEMDTEKKLSDLFQTRKLYYQQAALKMNILEMNSEGIINKIKLLFTTVENKI